MDNKVLFYNGALEEYPGGWKMVGIKCAHCGRTSYPATERCNFCGADDTEKVELSSIGTVYAFNVVRVPVADYAPNMVGGLIDLPEGVRLYGQIHAPVEKVSVGMKVRLQIGPLYTNKAGQKVFGFFYVPCT